MCVCVNWKKKLSTKKSPENNKGDKAKQVPFCVYVFARRSVDVHARMCLSVNECALVLGYNFYYVCIYLRVNVCVKMCVEWRGGSVRARVCALNSMCKCAFMCVGA